MGRDGTTERRAHSDGASVEWGLRDNADITRLIAHPWSLWNGFNWQLQVGFPQV